MQAYQEGQTHLQEGRYGAAIESHETALALAERELGPEHATTATLLNELAEDYRALSAAAQLQAERLYKRALAIYERALGPDHPYVAASLNNLALLYDDQGRAAEAEAHYRRSLGVLEQALGPDDPQVAASRSASSARRCSRRAMPTPPMEGETLNPRPAAFREAGMDAPGA